MDAPRFGQVSACHILTDKSGLYPKRYTWYDLGSKQLLFKTIDESRDCHSMDNRGQLTAYIRQLLSQGHPEANIRSHLEQHGYTAPAIDEAFRQSQLTPPNPPYMQPSSAGIEADESDKSYVGAWLLSLFLGGLGIDRFYLGFIITGILKLLTGGGIGIWAIIDFIRIGFGLQKDRQKRALKGYTQYRKVIKPLTAIALAFAIVAILGIPILLLLTSTPALNTNADNTSRQNDAAELASAVVTYIGKNNSLAVSTASGGLHTLEICGTSCSAVSESSAALSYYAASPSAVSYHTYASTLAVPDAKTVYLVNNATCKPDKSGIGAQTSGSISSAPVVILYALRKGGGIQQQCLSP